MALHVLWLNDRRNAPRPILNSPCTVSHVTSMAQALRQLDQGAYDVLVVQSRSNAAAYTRQLRGLHPTMRLLLMTENAADLEPLEMGANGSVIVDAPAEDLTAALEAVCRGQTYLHPTVVPSLLQELRDLGRKARDRTARHLTDREQRIVDLLAQGLSNREIGAHMKISISTVKTHLRSLFLKFGVTDRTQLMVRAGQS